MKIGWKEAVFLSLLAGGFAVVEARGRSSGPTCTTCLFDFATFPPEESEPSPRTPDRQGTKTRLESEADSRPDSPNRGR